MNELIRKASIEELVGHRQRALELYRSGLQTLFDARKAHALACPTLQHIGSPDWFREYRVGKVDEFATEMVTHLDRDMWRSIINFTKMGSLMDRQERETFEKQLQNEPPTFSVDNAFATLTRLSGDADMIFRRGLVNAFSRLCRDYKSNDGFKIGERIVITYGVSYDKNCKWWRIGERSERELQDVDRVMHILDDKPAPEYQQGLCAALRTSMSEHRKEHGPYKNDIETPYWRCRYFKNGNVHLFPKRPDLIRRANKLIAEHFGEVLAASWDARGEGAFEPAPREYGYDDQDFFRTPPEVAERLIDAANLNSNHSVLEPSAGEGDLADAIISISNNKSLLTCIEIARERGARAYHRLSTKYGTSCTIIVTHNDFLKVEPNTKNMVDRVIMNPPFSRGQDLRHVFHAYKFLKPGGRLISVMSAGIKANSIKECVGFRDWVTALGGEFTDLPADSFKASGTGVNTVMLVIDKPAEASRHPTIAAS